MNVVAIAMPEPPELSDRQVAMLDFIETFTMENQYPPTIREIGEACGISSTSVVNYNLDRLVTHGLITRDGIVSRGIRIVDAEDPVSYWQRRALEAERTIEKMRQLLE